jgi:hypothetical protein
VATGVGGPPAVLAFPPAADVVKQLGVLEVLLLAQPPRARLAVTISDTPAAVGRQRVLNALPSMLNDRLLVRVPSGRCLLPAAPTVVGFIN